jgi:hypothetical protein
LFQLTSSQLTKKGISSLVAELEDTTPLVSKFIPSHDPKPVRSSFQAISPPLPQSKQLPTHGVPEQNISSALENEMIHSCPQDHTIWNPSVGGRGSGTTQAFPAFLQVKELQGRSSDTLTQTRLGSSCWTGTRRATESEARS